MDAGRQAGRRVRVRHLSFSRFRAGRNSVERITMSYAYGSSPGWNWAADLYKNPGSASGLWALSGGLARLFQIHPLASFARDVARDRHFEFERFQRVPASFREERRICFAPVLDAIATTLITLPHPYSFHRSNLATCAASFPRSIVLQTNLCALTRWVQTMQEFNFGSSMFKGKHQRSASGTPHPPRV
jgi:hypothetical protein